MVTFFKHALIAYPASMP